MSFWSFWEKCGRFGAFGVGIGLIILGVVFGILRPQDPSEVEFFATPMQEQAEMAEIVVDVAGAVNKPGVYKFKIGSRLEEAISAAGGLSDKADKDWIDRNLNLARKLTDSEKIYIPEKGEVLGKDTSGSSLIFQKSLKTLISDLVNINTASISELETLPGIGSNFAQRIIDYRTAHGGFKSIEEIQAVSGIGQKTFEKIKDKITI